MALGAYLPVGEPANRLSARKPPVAFPSSSKVALLGFGTVGRALAELFCRDARSELRLTHIFNRDVARKRSSFVPDVVRWTEDFREVLASDADIVVELIGGIDAAHDFIRQALLAGKSVVTANKHVIAKFGPQLVTLARQNGRRIEFGASVGGGVPMLAALQHGLSGDRVTRIRGILNGTCNYVLSSMEAEGSTLHAALTAAQKLGYAESDPSDDVNGLDAACKLTILARHGLQVELNAFEIPRRSITEIQPADFHFARELGYTIRQISRAERNGDAFHVSVGPALVPLNSAFARTQDNQNTVVFAGERSGDSWLSGNGAGGNPTAVAVLSDLLAIARDGNHAQPVATASAAVVQNGNVRQYLRVRKEAVKKDDGHAILEKVLSDCGINVQKQLHSERKEESESVVLLEECGVEPLQRVTDALGQSFGTPLCLPVLD